MALPFVRYVAHSGVYLHRSEPLRNPCVIELVGVEARAAVDSHWQPSAAVELRVCLDADVVSRSGVGERHSAVVVACERRAAQSAVDGLHGVVPSP